MKCESLVQIPLNLRWNETAFEGMLRSIVGPPVLGRSGAGQQFLAMSPPEPGDELSTKDFSQSFDGKEERVLRVNPPFWVRRDSATRNHTMDVGMKEQFTSSCINGILGSAHAQMAARKWRRNSRRARKVSHVDRQVTGSRYYQLDAGLRNSKPLPTLSLVIPRTRTLRQN